MKPGYYWIKAESTDENSPYDGTVYSSEFTVVEQYDLTVKPADDMSKRGIQTDVTVGTRTVTLGADGTAQTTAQPAEKVTIKAKAGYVIQEVKVEKKGAALLTLSVCGETIYYVEGETWAEAIQNHPTENQGWEIYDGDVSHDNFGFLMQNDNFVPGTAKIDPQRVYDYSGI